MTEQRKIEIYSAGCPACESAIVSIRELACSSCSIDILDMNKAEVAARAKNLGIGSVPAVVIDGKLVNCGTSGGIDEVALKAAGLGQPLS